MPAKTAAPRAEKPLRPTAFYSADKFTREDSVGYLMRRTLSLLSQEVGRTLEPRGLTNAQWVPLLKLHMGQASTVAELARECELDTGAMTRMLDRLEGKGLVRRVRSEADRRVVNLELTDAGSKSARQIPAAITQVQNAYLAGFSVEEWKSLKEMLARMLATAQALQAQREKA